ncbi:MAG: hypothetical protein ACTSSF_01705 [Candidatus Heimdallarchaeaceae archaeon]
MILVAISLLLSFSFLLWFFLTFSIYKQYRYATIFKDLLPYYLPLNLFSFLIFILGVSLFIKSRWFFQYWYLLYFIGLIFTGVLSYFIIRWRRCYRLALYSNFLDTLSNPIYSTHLFCEYSNQKKLQFDQDKIHIFLRHDVDLSLSRLVKIIKLEKEKDIKSTSFFRLHSEQYTFSQAKPIIKQLLEMGFEIGYHFEVLSVTKGNTEKALDLFEHELEELRSIAPIEVVAHHGDKHNTNKLIWTKVNKESLKIWSAYDMKRDIYITDTGGKDMYRLHGKHIFEKLKEAKPGDIVQILIHADWWY